MEEIDEDRPPAEQLQSFLRERRARLSPAGTGLPVRARRSRGLTREDVAELLGVTPLWYALLESGRSGRRFSREFVIRVQDVLQLDPADREHFVALVIACGNGSPDLEAHWYAGRCRVLMLHLVRLAEANRTLGSNEARDDSGDRDRASSSTPLAR